MTARYNGYYNARVIIDEALLGYRDGFQEDYTQILPLDLYPNETDAPNMFPEMEDAIERCSKVIVRHSMPNPQAVQNKSEEHCRWIDDNWLVIGRAHYVKREYKEAKRKLKYISESEFYRGEVSVYEARIWLARTHIALGEYPEAKRVLILVENSIKKSEEKDKEKKKKPSKLERKRAKKQGDKKDKGPAKFPKRLKIEYELAMTELYIAQDENKKAIEHLEKAIVSEKWKRKRRARHMFVLGQLYEIQGNGSQAAFYFDKVSKSNAPYEMRFKAKIRNALAATGDAEGIVDELEKMLKDGKNLEYKDQIYYALAEIDMKKPDIKQAKINYTNSVLWSIKNDRQKGESYLRLADIHFNEKDYLKAQKYYDSCVQVLPEDYEGYERLKNKAEGLADLVLNYETVQFEDSVQMIGKMSPKEREKFIKQVIKDIKAEEERKRREEEQRLLAQQARVNQQQGGAGQGGGRKWYFSNPKLVATGFNEFRTLWGQRTLEDDWRRANKASLTQVLDENGEPVDSLVEDELTVDMLLADIPLTESALDSSNIRLIDALYKLGIIYKEQLKEDMEAKGYFQQVIDKRIEHPKVLPALYQLYLLNRKQNNPKADQYKSTIINNYPDSEIAQILQDPEYLKKKEIKDREELTAYGNVLRNYRRRSYGVVITACNKVIQEDRNNQFLNKYYLLKAFAVSQINPGNEEAISAPLYELVDLDADSEEGRQAQIYLDMLKKGEAIVDPIEPKDSPYVDDKSGKHFFVLFFPTKEGSVLETKNKISDFNKVFFKQDALTLQDAPLGSEYQVLVVRSFDDLEKANIYMTSFTSEKGKEILGSIPESYEMGLINTKNFGTLFKTREVEEYIRLYKEVY